MAAKQVNTVYGLQCVRPFGEDQFDWYPSVRAPEYYREGSLFRHTAIDPLNSKILRIHVNDALCCAAAIRQVCKQRGKRAIAIFKSASSGTGIGRPQSRRGGGSSITVGDLDSFHT